MSFQVPTTSFADDCCMWELRSSSGKHLGIRGDYWEGRLERNCGLLSFVDFHTGGGCFWSKCSCWRLGEEETPMDWAMKCAEVHKLHHEEECSEVLLWSTQTWRFCCCNRIPWLWYLPGIPVHQSHVHHHQFLSHFSSKMFSEAWASWARLGQEQGTHHGYVLLLFSSQSLVWHSWRMWVQTSRWQAHKN